MKGIARLRQRWGGSQRDLARLAHLSFRTIQLLEWGQIDPKYSTLQKILTAVGHSPAALQSQIRILINTPPEAVVFTSQRIVKEKGGGWKIWFFNFVDAFRKNRQASYVAFPPILETSPPLKALLASTVETLCEAMDISLPDWCEGIPPLEEPWFVSEMESLKAMALMESPIHFRKRNIFVLENFLERK